MTLERQLAALGSGPFTEAALREHVWPLFSRVLEGERKRGEIYLANHSLGRPLDQMAEDVKRALDMWYERMDECWDDGGWMDDMQRFRAGVAKLIGLSDPSAVIPKTSAGQGLRAVLNALPQDRPLRLVATRGEFDSVDFILKTYREKGRAKVRWVEPTSSEQGVPLYTEQDLLSAVTTDADLVVVSQVAFTTGQILPGLPHLVATAHDAGALVLVDVYHAAGVIPVHMQRLDADFMIGGSYKYTRGGPGACWLAIHPRHLDGSLRTLDTGWFAKRSPFSYARPEEPELAEGGNAWLESTPPILTFYQALSGLEFTLAIGIDRVREYSLRQQALLRRAFAENGVVCFQPEIPQAFGAFSLVPSNDAKALSQRLKQAGVNTDSRGGFVRFGPDLLNAEEELSRAAEATASSLRS